MTQNGKPVYPSSSVTGSILAMEPHKTRWSIPQLTFECKKKSLLWMLSLKVVGRWLPAAILSLAEILSANRSEKTQVMVVRLMIDDTY